LVAARIPEWKEFKGGIESVIKKPFNLPVTFDFMAGTDMVFVRLTPLAYDSSGNIIDASAVCELVKSNFNGEIQTGVTLRRSPYVKDGEVVRYQKKRIPDGTLVSDWTPKQGAAVYIVEDAGALCQNGLIKGDKLTIYPDSTVSMVNTQLRSSLEENEGHQTFKRENPERRNNWSSFPGSLIGSESSPVMAHFGIETTDMHLNFISPTYDSSGNINGINAELWYGSGGASAPIQRRVILKLES
jgi:hypothetical protein